MKTTQAFQVFLCFINEMCYLQNPFILVSWERKTNWIAGQHFLNFKINASAHSSYIYIKCDRDLGWSRIAISDFTMHVIISKWLRVQNSRQNRKTMRQWGRSEIRNCQPKCFHSFNCVIDHPSIRSFLNVNSLRCFLWCCLYYLLYLLSSDRFVALTS